MAYAPTVKKFSLKQEGLGRYSSILIRALLENGHNVTIACPKYCLGAVKEVLKEQNLNEDSVAIISTKKNPVLLDFFELWKNRERKKRTSSRFEKFIRRIVSKMLPFVVTEKSVICLSIFGILSLLCTFILGTVGLILGLLFGVLLSLYLLLRKGFRNFAEKLKEKKPRGILKKFREFYQILKKIYESEALKLIEYIRQDSMREILRKISVMKEKMDIWYSPTAFWPEFNQIEGKKILCAPDLVTIEFAEGFSSGRAAFSTAKTRKTLEEGDYFITYSEYIADSLLIKKLGKKEENIKVIPHAMNDMLQYLNIKDHFKLGIFNYDINKYFATERVLSSLVAKNINMGNYVDGFSFGDMKYIFYPSQIREHKNIWMLVRVYERLLRERHIPVKLVLTCDVMTKPDLWKYIEKKRLQFDVLFFKNVTNQQLAALYMCAQLVVTPTLYEGGFPFTFGEGMSVGTPSVMSDIPQVMDVLKQYSYIDKAKNWIFDAYSETDLENKLIYALDHVEELREKQQELFDLLNERTWKDVGKEYVDVFGALLSC